MTRAPDNALREIRPPWGPQRDFLKSGAVFRCYMGGQGSGKTCAGVFEVRRYAKLWPGAIVICTEPWYPMVADVLKPEFDRQIEAAGEAGVVEWRASRKAYVYPNGSEIWLRQCDKFDALRGPSVAAVWMDEAAQSPYEAFRILVGRMRQPGYPHVFLCTGTPRGRNWLYWTFTPGDRPEGAPPYIGDGGQVSAELFRASALDNPYLSPLTRAALVQAYPPGTLAYRQEVLGEAVVFEGLVFPQFSPERHVREVPPARRFAVFAMGMDWGWTNPGCLLLAGLDEEGAMWIVEEVYAAEKPLEWWAEQVLARARTHEPCVAVWCDPSDPAGISALARLGLPARKAPNQVLPGIAQVAARFQRGELYISPACPNLIRQLQTYSWRQSRTGEIRRDEPEKVDDHAVDALRYLVSAGFAAPAVVGRTWAVPRR